MKLRNKKTGEIVDTLCQENAMGIAFGIDHHDGNPTMSYYNSLNELNEDWEDFVGHYYFDSDGEIICEPAENKSSFDNDCEQIGNYFETREGAEKAVEKLKAWKRLKDKGFKFKGWNCATKELYFDVPDDFFPNKSYYTSSITEETKKDLDLLFGGEE